MNIDDKAFSYSKWFATSTISYFRLGNKSRLTLTTFLLFSITASHTTVASSDSSNKEVIKIVFGEGYPPYYDKGANKGAFIELLNEFSNQHPRFHLELESVSRKRLDEMVVSNSAQAFSLNSPIFMTPESRDKLLFSPPIWCTQDHLLSLNASPTDFNALDDLQGKSVGTIFGSRYGPLEKYFHNGQIENFSSYNYDSLFRALLSRRLDALVVNKDGVKTLLEKHNLAPNDIYLSKTPLYAISLVTVVSNKSTEFHETFSKFIRQSKNNGYLQTLSSAHGLTLVSSEYKGKPRDLGYITSC